MRLFVVALPCHAGGCWSKHLCALLCCALLLHWTNTARSERGSPVWLCMIPKLCLCANPSILRAALLSPCGHELARKSLGGGTWTGGYRGAGQVIFHDYGARKGPASPRLPFAANNFVTEAKDSRMPVPAVGDSSVAVWGRLLSFWPPSFILRSYPALRPCVQSFFFLEF
jgi:hypothetical protein